MKPNITSVNVFLPIEYKAKFNKHELSECSFILRNRNSPIRALDREIDSETIALIYMNEVIPKRKEKIRKKKEMEILVSELYRACMRYKVDCYAACCRFIEYKLGSFLECPDRISTNPLFTEQEGYWWDPIMEKTGYHKQSCGNILDAINIANGTKEHIYHGIDPVEYVYFNLKEEFIKFVNKKHKILPKHFKARYIDYSHMAYNNSADDF